MTDRLENSRAEIVASPRPARETSGIFWLILLAVVATVTAVGLSLWIPNLQRDRAVARINNAGGEVHTAPLGISWADVLVSSFRGEPEEHVVAVDFTGVSEPRDLMLLLTQFKELRQLSLAGPELTDDDLRPLLQLRKLELLVLVDCPNVGESIFAELQAKNPYLRVSHRGPALLGVMGKPSHLGCRIVTVRPGTAADRAGILVGDFVVLIQDEPVSHFDGLVEEIARYRPGDEITVTVVRRGRVLKLPVTLSAWGASQ